MNILAFDLGTSSVRGLVLDAAAVPLPSALARRPVAITVADDGTATLNASDYLAALVGCVDELAAAGHLDGVGLVATAAQWHSVLPLDRAGKPLGPMLTWLDTRATPLPGARGPADADEFHQRTGTWWHRFYWSVRLPWLRARSGTRPVRFAGLAEYIFGALLGDAPMSISQAAGTGLLDLRSLDWDEEACALASVGRDQLPELAPAAWRGRLTGGFARRWPALRDAWWAPPVGDGAASNVGSGCVGPDRVAVTVGTSAAVRLIQPAPAGEALPPLPATLWRYRVDREHIITGAAYSVGGNLYAWAKRELRLPKGPALDEALSRIPPGGGTPADALLGGDRPPGLAPAGSGRLCGIGFGTTAVDILAGLMNDLCRQVADDLAELESTVDRTCSVVLGGGAVTASSWWRESFAVTLAPREVSHVAQPEVGATGAGRLAMGRLDEAAGAPGAAIDRSAIGRMGEAVPARSTGGVRPQRPS